MNKVYRLVWNRAMGVLQVAAELVHSPRGVASACGGQDRRPARNRLAQACATALLMSLAAGPAAATTYTVTSPTDTGDTAAVGSLSWALSQAVDGDTIEITPTAISGTGALPAVNGTIHIVAPGDLSLDAALAGGTVVWSNTGTLTVLDSAPAVKWSVQSGDVVLGTDDAAVSSAGIPGGAGTTGMPGGTDGGPGQIGGDAATVAAGAGLTLSEGSALTGGTGGSGGSGGDGISIGGGAGGVGGTGGAGVSGSGFSLANAGMITGGAGGIGGAGGAGGFGMVCDPMGICTTLIYPSGPGGNGGAGGAGVT